MTNQLGTAAVTFDPEQFRAWLDAANEPGVPGSQTNQQVSPLLSTAYQRGDGEAGWLVETTLDMLHSVTGRHPDAPQPWVYGEGVHGVRVWATAHPEGGPDGGLAGEVTVDGAALSLGRISEGVLVPGEDAVMPGYEATAYALAAVAEQVNVVAGKYREVRGAV